MLKKQPQHISQAVLRLPILLVIRLASITLARSFVTWLNGSRGRFFMLMDCGLNFLLGLFGLLGDF